MKERDDVNANSERSGARHKALQIAAGARLVNNRSIGRRSRYYYLQPGQLWLGQV